MRFEPIRTRLDWADLEIEELHTVTAAWIEDQKLTLRYHHDVDAGIYTIWIDGFGQPPVEWGIMVGTIAHNLRASLDNTIYQLAILNSGQPAPDNRLQFPICSQPGLWKPQGGQNLIGVAQKAIVAIEQAQPYNFNDRPHALEILAALNDVDKHRSVHPIVSQLFDWLPAIRRSTPPAEIEWMRNDSDGSVVKSAVRYRVRPPYAKLEFDLGGRLPIFIGYGERGSIIDIVNLRVLSKKIRDLISGLAHLVGETL